MGLRDRLTNFFSKGEFARLQKDNAIAMTRPGLGRYEKQQEQILYHLQNTAYFFENEVSIFSEVLLALRREIFRNGIDWQPKFVVKCLKCGNEMDEKLGQCDFCGDEELREPNAAERMVFLHADGTSKINKINDNNQSLGEVLSIAERHLDVADQAGLFCQKAYVLEPDGSIKEAIPKEVIALDPRDVEFIHDDLGNPGTKGRVCIRHRDKLQASDATKCPDCGGRLYEVHYKGGKLSGKTRFYIDGEVLLWSKYNPSLVGGFPEIMKMADDTWAYHFIEKRVRSYYEKARVPGILTIPTNNPDSAYKTWKDCMVELKGDPYGVPWLNYDPDAKAPINYLKLMEDPNAGMLEIKKEIRERVGARFGVSMIFQADTSTSGGLNNEGLQITVTNRAVEWGQSLLNEKPLTWICQQWGIKDWILELNPSEEQDEMAEIQRMQANTLIAKDMLNMGFEVEYEDGEFKYSGHAKKQEPPPNPFLPGQNPFQGPPEQPKVQEPSGTPAESQPTVKSETKKHGVGMNCINDYIDPTTGTFEARSGFDGCVNSLVECGKMPTDQAGRICSAAMPQPETSQEKSLNEMSHEEFVDSLFDKSFVFSNVLWLLKAIMVAPLMGRFQKLAPQEAEDLYHYIIRELVRPDGWSVSDISKILRKKFPDLSDYDAERIVRTETTVIANKARELQYREKHPEAKYIWIGPQDQRTTKTCTKVKELQPKDGLPLDELRKFIFDTAIANGETQPRDWAPHVNCRHTFRRVF